MNLIGALHLCYKYQYEFLKRWQSMDRKWPQRLSE